MGKHHFSTYTINRWIPVEQCVDVKKWRNLTLQPWGLLWIPVDSFEVLGWKKCRILTIKNISRRWIGVECLTRGGGGIQGCDWLLHYDIIEHIDIRARPIYNHCALLENNCSNFPWCDSCEWFLNLGYYGSRGPNLMAKVHMRWNLRCHDQIKPRVT
jgi:hypothetical protein